MLPVGLSISSEVAQWVLGPPHPQKTTVDPRFLAVSLSTIFWRRLSLHVDIPSTGWRVGKFGDEI